MGADDPRHALYGGRVGHRGASELQDPRMHETLRNTQSAATCELRVAADLSLYLRLRARAPYSDRLPRALAGVGFFCFAAEGARYGSRLSKAGVGMMDAET